MTRSIYTRTDWVFTFSGRPFWPLEPRTEDVRLEDIAHGLSHLCRYAGQTHTFYSVAQHAVIVSKESPRRVALQALLHDASEAYLVDITLPVKRDRGLAGYRAIEERVQTVIYQRFGVPVVEDEEVKRIDRIVAATEIRDLVTRPAGWELPDARPLIKRIVPMAPRQAKHAFLKRYCELTGEVLANLISEGTRA